MQVVEKPEGTTILDSNDSIFKLNDVAQEQLNRSKQKNTKLAEEVYCMNLRGSPHGKRQN